MAPHVRLLGGPTLRIDGSWLAPPITRPVALLSYLAYRAAWVDRDELTALFWPETGQHKARQSLRSLLYQAKQGPHGHALEVEPQRVRWAIDTDVHTFAEAVSAGDWQAAVDVYAGTFLERVPGDDSPAFEAWLEETRDELHRSWRAAALHVADDLSTAGRARDASELLQRLLAHDFLDEDVLQAAMRAYAATGDRGRALEVFRTFSARLAEELDMMPLAATRQLADAIRDDAALAPARAAGPEGVARVQASGTPRPLTPFVGRRADLLELGNLLARPAVRLVTVLGPGGVGKSRLSLEVFETHRHAFDDGAAFVALEGLSSAADVPSAVSSALGLPSTGTSPIADDVVRHLRSRAMLVVLDNFEHLIDGGAEFLRRLLDAAPRCTFVCTSRTVLGLPGETVVDLAGLTMPSSSQVRDLESYDAVQLFVESARRARADFAVQESDRDDLVRLCALLDGMPLALELAANWVRLYRLSDLVGTLERDLDLLESTGHALSERHRSLRAVFDHSWRLLDDEQRRVLSTLAVFDGSFELDAVYAVAHADARTLLTLMERSLVRRTGAGRFSLHTDVRQYARERSTSEAVDRERHATYYLGLVQRTGDVLEGAAPTEALTALQQDLDNIRSAWRWACEHGRLGLCDAALEPLNVFFTSRALLHEGIAFFELALDRFADLTETRFLARLHHQLAYFARRLDRHAAASEHAREALRLAEEVPDALALTVDCLCELVTTNCWTGYFADAAAYAERALAHAEALRDPDTFARCTSRLALVRRYQGRLDEALRLHGEVLDHERRLGRAVGVVRALSDVGRVWVDLLRPEEAEAAFREGLDLVERHDLPYERAFMWEGLAQCSLLRGDLGQAEQRAETAVRCSEAVGDEVGLAVQFGELAKILAARGEPDRARTQLRRALKIAWDKHEKPELFKLFVTWATLPDEDPTLRATLLSWVARHPGAQAVSRREALELLGDASPLHSLEDLSIDALGRTVQGLLRVAG